MSAFLIYLNNFFANFTDYLTYIGGHISSYPLLLYIIGLVTIASAIDYIKRLLFM